ncbi:MAG: endolytic transglycosylase MltG [Bacillota bacterium]|nr:endolytic transglycosylase MltG [Bacillota bacterium]
MKKKILISTVVVLSLIVVVLTCFFFYYDRRNGKTINGKEEYFILKTDMSIEEAASALEKKSIIRSKKAFINYVNYYKLKNPYKAGNYIINSRTPMRDLILKLQGGKSDFAVVTIPEGYSLYRIATTLQQNNLTKKEDLLNTKLEDFDTNSLLVKRQNVTYDLEGYLFPDTYYIPYTADKGKIISLMYGEFSKVFTEKDRQRAKELGMSTNDIITIASLIEKEAANDEERSRIAGVIYNRLKKGMPLQIDAAVIYANTNGESNSASDINLKKDSKYNTYLYKGLPPGPIASPGKASIEAALYPEENDYLYYVAGPNGSVFSKTYEEHKQNVKKYLGK